MGTLVAYYSRAKENYFSGALKTVEEGSTEKVAKAIAGLTGADLFKIEPEKPYADDYDTCIKQAKEDLSNKVRPALKNEIDNLDKYDTIYLGYPNYWGTMPMVVYTFLENHDFSGKNIHPFCTHEGSGLSTTKTDIDNTLNHKANIKKAMAILGTKVSSMTTDELKKLLYGEADFIE